MTRTARFRFGRPLPTEPAPEDTPAPAEEAVVRHVTRCSRALAAEIVAVTPSWDDAPERLPRQTVSYEDREYGEAPDVVPGPPPAAKPRAPATPTPPDALQIVCGTLKTGPWHVKDICGMTELPFQAVYRVLMTLLRKKQVTRVMDKGSHYLYSLVGSQTQDAE